MTREPLEVLLTGASGFLGHYLLAELLARPHVRCRVLLRPPLAASSPRVERLLSDLGLDLAGLISDDRVALIEGKLPDRLEPAALTGVDTVLHAAGNTTFHVNGSGEPRKTNVDGTRAMLSASADAAVRRFVFVSTAYVCGEHVGHVPEVFSSNVPSFRNDYERSKGEAEQLVWDWADESRVATICRPSILFGDSRTGRATTMKGLYLVARATEILARAMDNSRDADRHHIPLRILGRSDATCNIIPIDWAARQIAGIVFEPTGEPSVHHITNPNPPTHAEVKRWLEAYFDIGGGRFSDETWPLEDANHYEDLFYSMGNICLDYFRHGLTFESQCAAKIPAGQPLLDGESFCQCIKYAQATQWGRTTNTNDDLSPPIGGIKPKWYFERFLPTAVRRSTIANVEALTAVVQYTITGAHGGTWIIRFEQGQLVQTTTGPTNLRVEFGYRLSYEDFQDVVACRKPLQAVFFHGSAEMYGDMERALKMVAIIGTFLREFPVSTARNSALAC